MDHQSDNNLQAFHALKTDVVTQLRKIHPGCKSELTNWTGKEVALLQEDLQRLVNGRISERWFYNYLKPASVDKLPREDMLDLLAAYVGQDSWLNYLGNRPTTNPGRKVKWWPWAAGLAIATSFLLWIMNSPPDTTDNHRIQLLPPPASSQAIMNGLEVNLLLPNESPIQLSLNEDMTFETQGMDKAKMVISGPYIQNDTLIRSFTEGDSFEQVTLKPDNFALLIHYLSETKPKDWQQRMRQLEQIFSADAQVYQVMSEDQLGMDLMNREQFIRKLIFPAGSLGAIEILDVVYEKDMIAKLIFTRND